MNVAAVLSVVLASQLAAPQRATIDAVFKAYTTATPGCALGVFRDGSIAYARGYGMADLEHRVPITRSSLFDVGSVSKQFAAAATTMLVDRGKMKFTDDIHKFIPELPNYGAPITLNELMWHTSGLRDYTDLLDLSGYGLEQATTDEDALAAIVRQRNLEFPSRTRYEYSNTNYFLLSVVVKRVTGQTLADFVHRNIFQPLGMTHTVYRTDYAMIIPNRAMGYAPIGNGRFKNSMSNWQQTGDGAVQISIDDAAKWDENFYQPHVGGAQMVDQLQTPGHLANGTVLQYARGLFVGNYRGVHSVTHGGAWIGYRAAFDRFPSLHTSVVVLCNSDAAEAEALAQRVEDIVLAPHLRAVSTSAAAKSGRATISASDAAGSYFDEAGAEVFHIAAHGSHIALAAGGAEYPLEPAGGSTFRLGSTPVAFDVTKDGVVTGFRLGSGDDASYARKFTPVTPASEQLSGVAGNYYSPELDVTWRLGTDGRTVTLQPSRYLPNGAAGKLHPQMADTFTSDAGFLIHFTRNASGTITSFSLSAGRGLRSLIFTRAP